MHVADQPADPDGAVAVAGSHGRALAPQHHALAGHVQADRGDQRRAAAAGERSGLRCLAASTVAASFRGFGPR